AEDGIRDATVTGVQTCALPIFGYAVPCVIRAEHEPLQGHRSSTFEWWDYVQTIPAPRVIVVRDIDEPRGQGAQWGEVQANIHKEIGRASCRERVESAAGRRSAE